jgi:hypothetical protein
MPSDMMETPIDSPCLILALADAADAARAARILRRQGWDVYVARNGPEARRLARMMEAERVVLGAQLDGESGWLTCDKLVTEMPAVKVVLVDPDPPENVQEFAAFVGAEAVVGSYLDLAWQIPAHRDAAAPLAN